MSIQGVIAQANAFGERLQLLLSNDRRHVNKINRDGLCVLDWSLAFGHHEGMLLLLRQGKGSGAQAFALSVR
jgi:hypothetical protein